MIEGIDIFKIMNLIGIKKTDRVICLDNIQYARNEVMKAKQQK